MADCRHLLSVCTEANEGGIEYRFPYMMSNGTIHALLVEDNPQDAHLIRDLVTGIPSVNFIWENTARLEDAKQLLREEPFDLVLLDLFLSDSQGLETYLHLHPHAICLPVVILAHLDHEMLAFEAVRAGAQDYLIKGQVDGQLVVRALRSAIERKRTETALRARNQQLAVIVEQLKQKASTRISVEELISRLVQELNNPLAIVTAQLEELLPGFAESDPNRIALQSIHAEIERMGKLVASLLQTPIEYGRQGKAEALSLPPSPGGKASRLEDEETSFFEALGAWVADYMLRDVPVMSRRLSNYLKRIKESGTPVHHPLSPREREVVYLIASGYTNKEIARRLSLSVRTVERHCTSIMNKLGMQKRAELIAYAVRIGIVSGEDSGD